MTNPLARLRFGVFLLLAIFVAVQVGEVGAQGPPGGGPGVPNGVTLVLAGSAEATSFGVEGFGGSVPSFAYERTLVCAPCAIDIAVTHSNVVVAGGGAVGILPPGKVYTIAGFFGEFSTTRLAAGAYAVSVLGAADAVREATPDFE